MRTYMTGNQSGAEKDNRLLFGEQLMLFFSKSKMVPWKIGPIRSGVKNSRWRRPRKAAMLEDSPPASTEDWDRSHGFPWGHKSRQGHAENAMQLQTRYLQCPVVPNDRGLSGKWPWWRPRDLSPSLAYLGWCKASWDDDLIGNQSKWIKVLTVVGFPSPALLRRVLNQTSHNLRCHELQYETIWRHCHVDRVKIPVSVVTTQCFKWTLMSKTFALKLQKAGHCVSNKITLLKKMEQK